MASQPSWSCSDTQQAFPPEHWNNSNDMLTQNTVKKINDLMLHKSSCFSENYCFSPSVAILPKNIHFGWYVFLCPSFTSAQRPCPLSPTCAHRCVCGGCRRIPEGRRSPPHTPPHSAAGRRGRSNGAGRMTRRCHTAWWQDSRPLQRKTQ